MITLDAPNPSPDAATVANGEQYSSLPDAPAGENIDEAVRVANDLDQVLQAAIDLHRNFYVDEAESLYRVILEARPQHADANFNLGILTGQRGQYANALPFFEAAIGSNPAEPMYWANYVDSLMRCGQVAAAQIVLDLAQNQGVQGPAIDTLAQELREETQLREGIGSVHGRVAPTPQEIKQLRAHFAAERYAQAIALARRLTAQFPDFALGWEVLGLACVNLSQMKLGIAALRRMLELRPDYIDGRRVLAEALRMNDMFLQAESECRTVLARAPNHAEVHRILALTLRSMVRFDDAVSAARRAVECAPDHGPAHDTLGLCLLDVTRVEEAEKHHLRAIELMPNLPCAHENRLFCLSHRDDVEPNEVLQAHLDFAKHCEQPLLTTHEKHKNVADPDRRLRVGFVSGDFNGHPVAVFMEPILRHLATDPSVTVHAYYNRTIHDGVTQRLRSLVEHWHDVVMLTDVALARKIRSDGIDVLIDLSGHTGHNRLLTFARRPAPVQATWMGYLGTTGMASMDYYIADRHYVPREQIEGQFVEKIAYLPAFAAFQPAEGAPEINPLPALSNGYITFGSFNRFGKLRPRTIALWAELLRALPTSRLIINGAPRDGGHGDVVDWFDQAGVPADRLEFRPRADVFTYLKNHNDVDIALDTFPYGGGVTTFQGLWMGVPTLTLPGDMVASRGSTSALSHAGLESFVAADRADYIARGVSWANKLDELAQIRATMRERCGRSPSFEPDTVGKALSRAVRTMWQKWCAGEAPATFEV